MTPDDSDFARLSPAQRAALRHVEDVVRREEPVMRARVADLLERAGCSSDAYGEAMAHVQRHARVVVHFHPDRIGFKAVTVAEALLTEGVYRNQFETGLFTGSLSAFPGGARDNWEATLFGGAYFTPGVTVSDRPKYGALELVRYPDGPIRGLDRATSYCVQQCRCGHHSPSWGVKIPRLVDILNKLPQPRGDTAVGDAGRVLDTQIEAHVHGPLELTRDVELLVADSAFAASDTGTVLRQLAERYDVTLQWHSGFRLAVRDVPDDFRGPAMPALARRIAGDDGTLDAAVIGRAEASLRNQPDTWRDWKAQAEALEHLKQLWHVVVHYGTAAGRAPIPS